LATPELVNTLLPLLQNPDSDIRLATVIALNQVMQSNSTLDKQIIAALQPLLQDLDSRIRTAAASTLTTATPTALSPVVVINARNIPVGQRFTIRVQRLDADEPIKIWLIHPDKSTEEIEEPKKAGSGGTAMIVVETGDRPLGNYSVIIDRGATKAQIVIPFNIFVPTTEVPIVLTPLPSTNTPPPETPIPPERPTEVPTTEAAPTSVSLAGSYDGQWVGTISGKTTGDQEFIGNFRFEVRHNAIYTFAIDGPSCPFQTYPNFPNGTPLDTDTFELAGSPTNPSQGTDISINYSISGRFSSTSKASGQVNATKDGGSCIVANWSATKQ
jgi:hypothetical protein